MIPRLNFVILTAALAVGPFLPLPVSGQAQAPAAIGTGRSTVILALIDRSESTTHHVPPETTLPFSLHLLDLAALSGEDVRIGFIFFGGDVVAVGDENGLPTAAHDVLRRKLLTAWPPGRGNTPMDEAFLKAVQIVQQLPPDTDITLILITDGQPDSGRLRPADFPPIKHEMEAARKFVLERHRSFAPLIQQEKLAELDREFADLSSDRAQKLLAMQRALEMEKSKEYATNLKNQGVRFVTVDMVNNPALVALHESAGGTQSDLVVTSPNNVLAPLHKLRIISLPRVVDLPLRELANDPRSPSANSEFEVPLENVADAGFVTVEFHPAIVDFANQFSLTADIDGSTVEFELNEKLTEATLATDAAGHVATATLRIRTMPTSGTVRFRWNSTGGQTLSPATVYTFLRLKETLTAEFRPAFAQLESRPPFNVSPSRAVQFTGALTLNDKAERVAVQGMEAVLRHKRTGQQVRMAMEQDLRTPGKFLTAPMQLSEGFYDAEIHYLMASGATVRMQLPAHVQCLSQSEAIALDMPQPGAGAGAMASFLRTHLGFGVLGDVSTTHSINVRLRSVDVEHPVKVRPSVEVTDQAQQTPSRSWFRCQPETITLLPGKPTDFRITLEIPPDVEPTIQDGPFEGRLVLTDVDTQATYSIQRFQPLSGVEEAVERVTFELKRPRFVPRIRRAFRNWLWQSSDGTVRAKVRNTIASPFQRVLTLEVSHDSTIERQVQLFTSGQVLDAQGRHIPSMRVIPLSNTEMTQTVAPGECAKFELGFEVDEDCAAMIGTVDLDLSGPGVVPQHISLEIERREPLLERTLRSVLYSLAICGFAAAVIWFRRWRGWRRFSTDSEFEVTAKRNRLPNVLNVVERREGLAVRPMPGVEIRHPSEGKYRPAGSHELPGPGQGAGAKPINMRFGTAGGATTLRIEETVLIPGEPPALRVRVEDGGKYDDLTDRAWRWLRRSASVTGLLFVVAAGIRQPAVIRLFQWCYDLIVGAV